MSTLFALPPQKVLRLTHYHPPRLAIRFLRHLVICLVSTFGVGFLLASFAVPRIVLSCIAGDSRGFFEVVLMYIWLRSLDDMWSHTWSDLLRLRKSNRSETDHQNPETATDAPEI
jgi:hypothetical protein